MRAYDTLTRLAAGEVVDLQGIKLVADGAELSPSDLYVAERNTGSRLLTVRSVHKTGFVIPVEHAYSYDRHECVKVRSAD
jgi:hypothetical protein